MTLGMKYDEFKREGLEEGRTEGMKHNQQETAKKMLSKKYPLEEISELLNIPLEQLQQLQREIVAV